MNDTVDTRQPAGVEPRGGSGEMFDAIAPRYDLLNRLLSLGIDQRWRRLLVQRLQLSPQAVVLDHATGTADLALLIARSGPGVRVIGIDPSTEMLRVGRAKVEAAGLSERVTLQTGQAEELSGIGSQSVDAVSMAFGIRNVPDRPRALREMARVTRPGGRIAILELSEPQGGLLGPLARVHVHQIVPWLGGLISGAREYRYLQRSIAAFPPPAVFADLMKANGIRVESVEALTFGVCHLYVGTPAP
ncbi:MAG TPA: ubiquinone/menaquinone biosynthesis methyltransferase [Polyangiaceae bacterium]|nr:ubiquinone/menaquinone biosynthesis methyltransferase [Polyangiaceae bacterium]